MWLGYLPGTYLPTMIHSTYLSCNTWPEKRCRRVQCHYTVRCWPWLKLSTFVPVCSNGKQGVTPPMIICSSSATKWKIIIICMTIYFSPLPWGFPMMYWYYYILYNIWTIERQRLVYYLLWDVRNSFLWVQT